MTAAEELHKLQMRVMNGIVWLDQHDPSGAFHLWYEAGLTPLSPMPAHTEDDARERFTEYYAARRTFDRLEAELVRLDPACKPTTKGAPTMQWKPEKEKR